MRIKVVCLFGFWVYTIFDLAIPHFSWCACFLAGVNQEQSSGIGSSYPAQRDDNNGNGNGYDSIQSGEGNPSCLQASQPPVLLLVGIFARRTRAAHMT